MRVLCAPPLHHHHTHTLASSLCPGKRALILAGARRRQVCSSSEGLRAAVLQRATAAGWMQVRGFLGIAEPAALAAIARPALPARRRRRAGAGLP